MSLNPLENTRSIGRSSNYCLKLFKFVTKDLMQSPTQVKSRYEIGRKNDNIYSGPKCKPFPRHTLTLNTSKWAPSNIRARVSTQKVLEF